MYRRGLHPLVMGSAMVLVGLITSCESTLEPIELNPNEPYSLFGSLDANSSRQWIRVTPVRDSLFNGNLEIDAMVTLFDHDTEQSIELTDSLFYRIIGDGETIYFNNFWTDVPIIPEHSYTLTVTNSDGYSSTCTISIPPDYEAPVMRLNAGNQQAVSGNLSGEGIDRVVVMDVAYDVTVMKNRVVNKDKIVVSQLFRDQVRQYDNGRFSVNINDREYLEELFGIGTGDYLNIDSAKIFMAAGNESWPEASSLSFEELALPEIVSNVEGGLGVVVGINTMVLPLKSCLEDEERVPCTPLSIPFEKVYEYNRYPVEP